MEAASIQHAGSLADAAEAQPSPDMRRAYYSVIASRRAGAGPAGSMADQKRSLTRL